MKNFAVVAMLGLILQLIELIIFFIICQIEYLINPVSYFSFQIQVSFFQAMLLGAVRFVFYYAFWVIVANKVFSQFHKNNILKETIWLNLILHLFAVAVYLFIFKFPTYFFTTTYFYATTASVVLSPLIFNYLFPEFSKSIFSQIVNSDEKRY